MAMEQLGIAGMDPELKQTYDRLLLSIAEKDAVYLQYGVQKSIPARGGKSIEWRRFERIDVPVGSYILTEGTPPTETNATISTVTATISQYGQYSRLTDLVTLQSFDNVLAEFVKKYGIAAQEGLDVVVRNALSAATTLQYASTATRVNSPTSGAVGSGMYLNAAELNEMKRTLRRAGARPHTNGKFICLIHPDNTKDLFEDPDIVDAFQHAAPRSTDNPMFTGVLGDWMGFTFVETNQLRLRTSYGLSGADIYEVLVLGAEAYGVTKLSTQSLRTYFQKPGGVTDPLEQYSTVGWKASLAATILNNEFMGLIYVNSSRTTAA